MKISWTWLHSFVCIHHAGKHSLLGVVGFMPLSPCICKHCAFYTPSIHLGGAKSKRKICSVPQCHGWGSNSRSPEHLNHCTTVPLALTGRVARNPNPWTSCTLDKHTNHCLWGNIQQNFISCFRANLTIWLPPISHMPWCLSNWHDCSISNSLLHLFSNSIIYVFLFIVGWILN